MKLKVTPEGRRGVYTIAPADLRPWLDDWFSRQEYMHNYIANDNSRMFIGADWTRSSFDAHLEGDVKWAIVIGEQDGVFAGHRLICVDMNDENRPMRYVFDIGNPTHDDIEIIGDDGTLAAILASGDKGWYEIKGKNCTIYLEPRPAYCDRGHWYAKLDHEPPLNIDYADGWPRYYFDFDRAKLELEDWLRWRKQWIDAEWTHHTMDELDNAKEKS